MKRKTELDILNAQIRKSNSLIQKAKYSLTIQQMKIILYLISQIEPWDTEFRTYKLNILEFARVCGIDTKSGGIYEMVKEQIQRISDRSYWVTLEDGNTQALVRWIEEPKINKNSGIIELKLNENLKPYLLQLKEKYTEYELIYPMHFKSKYSIRLYELVCSLHFYTMEQYTRYLPLDKLKQYLDCASYSVYRDFRRDVLEKAIKEINEYSDKNVTYEAVKEGKKVIGIEITISTKDALDRVKVGVKIEEELGLSKAKNQNNSQLKRRKS